MQQTPWLKFVGQNIKGTPAMKLPAVAHDLRVVKAKGSVAALQEFKWPWYWRAARKALPKITWGSYPKAFRNDKSSQPVMWRRDIWKKIEARTARIHKGHAGISEDRHINGVLLKHRETGLRCWFVSTHYVVGGDHKGSGALRKVLLGQDLAVTKTFLAGLVRTGFPVVLQMDANIHRHDSWAYAVLPRTVNGHKVKYHGALGIEYLLTIDNTKAKVEVKGDFIIPTSELRTDHEGRGITFRLTSN